MESASPGKRGRSVSEEVYVCKSCTSDGQLTFPLHFIGLRVKYKALVVWIFHITVTLMQVVSNLCFGAFVDRFNS